MAGGAVAALASAAVAAGVSAPAASAASATALSVSFTVGSLAPRTAAAATAAPRATATKGGIGPSQRFHSAPGLRPPAVSFSRDPDHSSGDIFLTPSHSPQRGPMILDSRGRVVWFMPRRHGTAENLLMQSYRGKPVLTWWEAGPGRGRDVIMSRSYRVVRVVHAGNGYTADVHEFQLTPQGTALLDAVVPVKADLTSVGGPRNGMAYDCVIQEVDIRTDRVLWEWHAMGHVPLNASYVSVPKKKPYDFFHLNSIQQLPDGNLIVSARDTWAVYEINRQTGHIIWTLGGKYSDFTVAPGAGFEWQHYARLSGRTLTLFDDADPPQEEPQSSGKVLRLDLRAKTADLVKRYVHSPPLLSSHAGSMQTLPNGNVFIDWGGQPDFSEYAPGGRQIFNGSFAEGVSSYRAVRFAWHGQPLTRPAIAVAAAPAGRSKVWASWNGATNVRWWRVLGGSKRSRLRSLKTVRRTGFETAIVLRTHPRYVAVEALDARHHALSSSRPHAHPTSS